MVSLKKVVRFCIKKNRLEEHMIPTFLVIQRLLVTRMVHLSYRADVMVGPQNFRTFLYNYNETQPN